MRTMFIAAVVAMLTLPAIAQQPNTTTYVARPGEIINLGPIYYMSPTTCQNLAVAKSDFEIISGPPGLAVEVREAMIIPSAVSTCKNEIKGGNVYLTIPPDIEGTTAHVVARMTHHERNGPQQRAFVFNLVIAR